jgi:DNA-binding response OmpR family regulator
MESTDDVFGGGDLPTSWPSFFAWGKPTIKLELLKRIRLMRDVPALALSGFGMDEDVTRSRDAGFSDHLTKPVSIDRLQAAIAQLNEQNG